MSNLFTEVSVEQQEVVSGGAPAQAIDTTLFASLLNTVGATSTSGPGGSTSASAGISDKRFTAGLGTVIVDSGLVILPTIPAFPAL
ncbi:hypothetical protein BV378_27105 [Nostoc sp. RF31YmG]|jgi:hypothetical protein|nr:hypothetical protein BV378_27105 [Nostoc sp. RF31YmG]